MGLCHPLGPVLTRRRTSGRRPPSAPSGMTQRVARRSPRDEQASSAMSAALGWTQRHLEPVTAVRVGIHVYGDHRPYPAVVGGWGGAYPLPLERFRVTNLQVRGGTADGLETVDRVHPRFVGSDPSPPLRPSDGGGGESSRVACWIHGRRSTSQADLTSGARRHLPEAKPLLPLAEWTCPKRLRA